MSPHPVPLPEHACPLEPRLDTSPPRFDLQPIAHQLHDEAYRLVAALPLFAFALALVVLAWMLGGCAAETSSGANPSGSAPTASNTPRVCTKRSC